MTPLTLLQRPPQDRFLNFILSWSIEAAREKRLAAGPKAGSAQLRANPACNRVGGSVWSANRHRNRVA